MYKAGFISAEASRRPSLYATECFHSWHSPEVTWTNSPLEVVSNLPFVLKGRIVKPPNCLTIEPLFFASLFESWPPQKIKSSHLSFVFLYWRSSVPTSSNWWRWRLGWRLGWAQVVFSLLQGFRGSGSRRCPARKQPCRQLLHEAAA